MNTNVMNTNALSLIGQLSDQQLVAQVKLLAQRERDATASLIARLAVLDERGLYRAEGCSSMFTYCLEVLHLSEHAAYARIEAARAARKYPLILELLGDGSVNLTTVTLLSPHLTPENHGELLAAAKHQRKRQVEELVARLRPLPSIPSSMRKLPPPKCISAAAPDAAIGSQAATDMPTTSQASADLPAGSQPVDDDSVASVSFPLHPPCPPAPRAVVEPLAPERYKVQFTASVEMCEKLRRAQDLLRHQIPDGDLGEVMDRALTALLKDLERKKFAARDRPRASTTEHLRKSSHGRTGASVSNPRHIPAEVRRMVWSRDNGRCAFVAHNGRRCTERAFLEFHHVVPHAMGGEATAENIQLRCRAHNGYEAELHFGLSNYQRRAAGGGDTEANQSAITISTRSRPSHSGPMRNHRPAEGGATASST